MPYRRDDGSWPVHANVDPSARLDAPVTITVPGPPVAKGRPRHTRAGRTYTPPRTRSYERTIAQMARLAMRSRPPIAGPVKVDIAVDLPIPRSWSRQRKAHAYAGLIAPAGRPDLDNYVKCIDGLNGIVVADDGQVVIIEALKRYGLRPQLVITVTPLEPRGVTS